MKRKRRGRANAKGRSEGKDPFIRIPRAVYDHPAVRSLSSSAFRVWVHMIRYHYGNNNGEIALSVRGVSDRIRMNKNTASRATDELRRHGLITIPHKGQYQGRLASTFRLTHLPTKNAPPTEEYLYWNDKEKKLVL